jgi:hypothetical protein
MTIYTQSKCPTCGEPYLKRYTSSKKPRKTMMTEPIKLYRIAHAIQFDGSDALRPRVSAEAARGRS